MSEPKDARNAVHDALPPGWRVNRPEWHVEDDRWHVFAADHRPGRKRPDYVEAVGMDEAHCLRGLAELLRGWQLQCGEERW